jgi:hypothetical protein
VEDLPGRVALEASDDLAPGFAFLGIGAPTAPPTERPLRKTSGSPKCGGSTTAAAIRRHRNLAAFPSFPARTACGGAPLTWHDLRNQPGDASSGSASGERHFSIETSPVTPTPYIVRTNKTVGQEPFPAGSRIATHHMMRHRKHVTYGASPNNRRSKLACRGIMQSFGHPERQTSVTSVRSTATARATQSASSSHTRTGRSPEVGARYGAADTEVILHLPVDDEVHKAHGRRDHRGNCPSQVTHRDPLTEQPIDATR